MASSLTSVLSSADEDSFSIGFVLMVGAPESDVALSAPAAAAAAVASLVCAAAGWVILSSDMANTTVFYDEISDMGIGRTMIAT